MPERGVIKNREYGAQVRDFSRLRIGNITPTDLDMLIEYHDKCFIFAETKFNNIALSLGQSLALERLCDACERAGKSSILFITTHSNGAGEDIDMDRTVVTAYRYRFKWETPGKPIYLGDAVLSFIQKFGE
jgi:hypothetical protein